VALDFQKDLFIITILAQVCISPQKVKVTTPTDQGMVTTPTDQGMVTTPTDLAMGITLTEQVMGTRVLLKKTQLYRNT
jgi:hypothetical protein